MRVREKQITFWTTFSEYKDIKIRADKVGLSMSDYIRNRAIGYELREKPSDEFFEALKKLRAEIRAVGNNLNQIARLANETSKVDELYCKKQIDKLNEIILDAKTFYLLPKKEDEICQNNGKNE